MWPTRMVYSVEGPGVDGEPIVTQQTVFEYDLVTVNGPVDPIVLGDIEILEPDAATFPGI